MNKFKKVGSLLILVTSAGCLSAGELPDTENMQGLQFNFSTPGARSLGMGGAFLARADDATTAMANPAGLVNLSVPEISLEYRHLEYKTSYATGGVYPDQGFGKSKTSADNISYFSFVKPGDKFTWALFRHQLMDFNTEFDTGQIEFPDFETSASQTSNKVESEIVTYGLSGAFRIGERVSLGASLQYFDFSLDGSVKRFFADSDNELRNQQLQTGDDKGWGITLGGLFKLTDRLSMGLVYRNMPGFDVDHISANADLSSIFYERQFDFDVPQVFGVGFSFQASDNLTINFDVNMISYSDLASPSSFWAFSDAPTDEQFNAASSTKIDDGTEIRLGVEYLLPTKPVALRAGVWREPGHSLEFNGDDTTNWGQVHDAFFAGNKDETHFAIGLGVFQEKFSFDVAADFSDIQNVYSLSGVYYFN